VSLPFHEFCSFCIGVIDSRELKSAVTSSGMIFTPSLKYTAVCVEIKNINANVMNLTLPSERIPLTVRKKIIFKN
jgi:hypothetical protein